MMGKTVPAFMGNGDEPPKTSSRLSKTRWSRNTDYKMMNHHE